MKAADRNLINNYYSLLKSLSSNDKLELIAKLSQSMKSNDAENSNDKSWMKLFGALELEIPIEEFITELKKERNFTNKSIDL